MPAGTELGDYFPFLADLTEKDKPYFLEGGQAVNFWAEYFAAKTDHALDAFKPFTSKDCDIWVGWAALKYLETLEPGTLIKGKSPADGQVGIYTTHGEPSRTIDLMSSVYGIPQTQQKRLQERALEINRIRVLDPLHLFNSKCHCLVELDQTDRQDDKHLRMLCLIVPDYLLELLGEAQAGRLTQRDLINEIKLLRSFGRDQRVKRALSQIEVALEQLIPLADFTDTSLTKLQRFIDSSLGTPP